MQSIFSSAARRHNFGGSRKADRRDGELKMDWTKPLPTARPMGIEWSAWLPRERLGGMFRRLADAVCSEMAIREVNGSGESVRRVLER